MDASEYIDTVTGQMRCKRARAAVAKELADHIQDQTDACLAEGMTLPEAREEAVRQMGDAVEVGMRMDCIHRPRLDKRTLILVGIFSLAAVFFQYIVQSVMRDSGWVMVERKWTFLQVLLGAVVMLALLYGDYTVIGRFPRAIWIGLLCLLIGFGGNNSWIQISVPVFDGSFTQRLQTYLMLGLLLPAFAGIIYRYRSMRWRGLLISFAWMAVGLWAAWCSVNVFNRSYVLYLLFGFVMLISYAVAKGWYGISRGKGLCAVWGCLGMAAAGMIVYKACAAPVQIRMRIAGFINPFRNAVLGVGTDASGGVWTAKTVTEYMREALNRLSWIGKSTTSLKDFGPANEAMSFFLVVERLGIIAGLLILAGLVLLFFFMLKGTFEQKSVLGGLVGMACILGLFVPIGIHLLCNIGLLPLADAVIPFLYPGWIANLSCYTLLGFYLCVHRYTDVAA